MPRVIATVDIGTNSTRLLICSIEESAGGRRSITDLERHSNVTRLGDGVDSSGRLDPAARERVLAMLDQYRKIIELYPVDETGGVLTSAGRDAADGADFTEEILARTGIAVKLIGGDEEARLSFAGATSEREPDGETILVCDVGGGSTELIVGRDETILFHTSLDAGVVRQSERHIGQGDPPTPEQLDGIAAEVRELIASQVPEEFRSAVSTCIAVAGTATTLSAIDQSLEPYDPTKVHGATVTLDRSREILGRIASLPLNERRDVAGLHPDRAPTAVAGAVILCEVLTAFGLDSFTASEHDILRGEALLLLAGISS
ncbi:MAG: Ppx/GppA phosphatase family protein [Actinomycetes bacterium]